MKHEYKVANNLQGLSGLLNKLRGESWFAVVSPNKQYVLELTIEEMVTNIIKYGYDDLDNHLIEVSVRMDSEDIIVEVCDDGHEFDPLNASISDTEECLERRAIGGVGIHLVRSMSQKVSYVRRQQNNILNVVI